MNRVSVVKTWGVLLPDKYVCRRKSRNLNNRYNLSIYQNIFTHNTSYSLLKRSSNKGVPRIKGVTLSQKY